MNCHRWLDARAAYADGTLAGAARADFETHLVGCAACRADLAGLRALPDLTRALPRAVAPARDLWAGIASQLEAQRADLADSPAIDWPWRRFAPWALAAGIVVLSSVAARRADPAWSVAPLQGVPEVDRAAVVAPAGFRPGQWLATDASSRARIAVGRIGEAELGPGSRVRLRGVSGRNHRLELARGSLRAVIWAPPRLFFVDTPAATAVDLGCAYTLEVDDRGDGELAVTLGYVALAEGDRESLVPAGARCRMRRGHGPGTPFADDAPAALRAALAEFDFVAVPPNGTVGRILAAARPADAVTLWHLLGRTAGAERAAVCDALARTHPLPPGSTRDGILAGDIEPRRAWAESIGLGNFSSR